MRTACCDALGEVCWRSSRYRGWEDCSALWRWTDSEGPGCVALNVSVAPSLSATFTWDSLGNDRISLGTPGIPPRREAAAVAIILASSYAAMLYSRAFHSEGVACRMSRRRSCVRSWPDWDCTRNNRRTRCCTYADSSRSGDRDGIYLDRRR
jgi:hypothetical protein